MNFWIQSSNNLFKVNKSARPKRSICSILKIKLPVVNVREHTFTKLAELRVEFDFRV